MKTYRHFGPDERGHLPDALATAAVVVVQDASMKELTLSATGHRKSPTGFAWGYEGSGPAALAHSILVDLTGSETVADGIYHDFKRAFIAGLPEGQGWFITEAAVKAWLAERAGAGNG